MTIQVSGHVQSTDFSGSAPGTVKVSVTIGGDQGESPIIFYVPKEQAKEWVVGSLVQITAHAYVYRKGE